jgi:subtilase family serine protease
MRLKSSKLLRLGIAGSALAGLPLLAATGLAATPQIVAPITDTNTVALKGDLSAAVKLARDEGALSDAMVLPHIRLELRRPAAQQAALDALVKAQWTRGSAEYHKWLSPSDLARYAPSAADVQKISNWLQFHGLVVNSVSRDGMTIDFGGTAGAVARAFQTRLHTVSFGGATHITNMSAPLIPAAIAPAVVGVTLHNFFPTSQNTKVTPGYTSNGPYGTFYAVAPPDFNTIYNVNPLLNGTTGDGPATGAGITIAVVEQTKILAHDWNKFRSTFGLSGYAGTLMQIHPGGCTDPGFTGDEVEAAIDAEWASAPAPDATILEASCATEAPLNFGVEQALENLVTYGTPATIFSISYGGAEIFSGYSFVAGWTNLVEEGAAEGKSIFVSSGDSGSAADRDYIGTDGLGVNGLSDSAYVTAVGGTDFEDTYLNQDSTYWHAHNGPTGESALSYIPETPWNNSCASSLIFRYSGYATAAAACNSATPPPQQDGVGGTGGQSLYAVKPSFQLTTIPGMPNDNARDQPDVSLFAANGIWGHFYIICMSDASEGGSPCDYKNQNDLFGNAYGGTSVSAPAFAGITALLGQVANEVGVTGGLGNLAPALYTIANGQFNNPTGLTPCDSTLGKAIGVACVFNVITDGSNVQPCVAGSTNCSMPPGDAIGQLVQPTVGPGPAFHAGQGYSLATGLGSVNATNLLLNFVSNLP